jgi:hypothetical protein
MQPPGAGVQRALRIGVGRGRVYGFHCGMSKVGYENWVWWSPDLHNSYMGRRMLRCGMRLETFEEE